MSLYAPDPNEFLWQISNVDTVRPAGAFGTSVSFNASANTKGTYTQVLSALPNDAFGVLININSVNVNAANGDCLIDIGIDTAGGTSYTVLIPDLYASCAGGLGTGSGINFYFPIRIPAGSTVAVRGQRATAAGTFRAIVRVFGRPRDPKQCKYGTKVVSFGVTSASSNGTTVTPGTTSEGTYTQIGVATTTDFWWWQIGFGVTSTAVTAGLQYGLDLAWGDASNKIPIISDQYFTGSTANEDLNSVGYLAGAESYVKTGSLLYLRAQCSGTSSTGPTGTVYGLQ